jgi:hypothetical protein
VLLNILTTLIYSLDAFGLLAKKLLLINLDFDDSLEEELLNRSMV